MGRAEAKGKVEERKARSSEEEAREEKELEVREDSLNTGFQLSLLGPPDTPLLFCIYQPS